MDLISVIIPVYKVEKYLKKCVDSVINQTYRNLEIFLVDDGSPDNCGDICDEYAAKDSRIKVIHKANGGLSDARNAALDVITGEYVCFVDSDDWIPEKAVEEMLFSLKQFDVKVAIGNMDNVDENGALSELFAPSKEMKLLRNEEIFSVLGRPNACGKLYSTDLFKTVRYPVGRLYEDVFTWHKILEQIDSVVLTGSVNYYYFIRSGSIMRDEYNIRFTDIIFAIKARYEWLDAIGQTQLAEEARLFIYSRVAVAYAHLDKHNPEHKAKLDEITAIYNDCYKILIKSKRINIKQKIRLALLKHCPALHTALWGKKMPISLG